MKIGIDVSSVQTRMAGIGRFTYDLASHLVRMDQKNEYVLHGVSFSLDYQRLVPLGRFPNVTLNLYKIPGNIKRFYWNKLRFPSVELLTGKMDVFHATEFVMPPFKKKKVVTIHDLIFKRFPQYFPKYVLKMDNVIKKSVEAADIVFTDSKSTKRDVEEFYHKEESRVHVVYGGVNKDFRKIDRTRFSAVLGNKYNINDDYILFVGTLEPRKNIIMLVKSYMLFKEKTGLKTKLVIIGKKGWYYNEIFAAIEESRWKDDIVFLEYVDDRDLPYFYSGAKAFVYLSLYEGFGLPVLEAMACGTPVITSNCSSIPEIVGSSGLMVDANDMEKAAFYIEKLLIDKDFHGQNSESCLKRAGFSSWEESAKKVISLYNSL
ncbi:MAG: glycosyltransferase family 1 protein [bacterium]